MTMIPDQVMDAIHFAEFVMAKEKMDRIGSTADTVYPMKFFFFHDQKAILGLMGGPSHHPTLDDKDVNALLVRMCALALDAKAVLHVTECWTAERCPGCGASVTESANRAERVAWLCNSRARRLRRPQACQITEGWGPQGNRRTPAAAGGRPHSR